MLMHTEDENLIGPVAPFKYVPATENPNLIGTLEVILAAKRNGNPWADCALIEVGRLTGVDYVFKADISFDRVKYEIAVAP